MNSTKPNAATISFENPVSYGTGNRFAHIHILIELNGESDYRNRYVKVSNQIDDKSAATKESYAWKIECNPSDNTMESMESALKTLKPIHKRLSKMQELAGRPNTFSEWALQVLNAAKVETVIFKNGYPITLKDEAIRVREQLEYTERELFTKLAPMEMNHAA